jgi:hypothetical protein
VFVDSENKNFQNLEKLFVLEKNKRNEIKFKNDKNDFFENDKSNFLKNDENDFFEDDEYDFFENDKKNFFENDEKNFFEKNIMIFDDLKNLKTKNEYLIKQSFSSVRNFFEMQNARR